MAFLIPIGLVTKKVLDHRRESGGTTTSSSMLSSFKTRTDLKNDLFCIQEERDYFEGKFLEQVSELQAVKEDLKQAKKEIRRLRTALMETSELEQPQHLHRQHDDTDNESQHHVAEEDDASSLTADDELEEVRNRQEDGSFQTTPSKAKYSDEKANDAANEEDEEEDEDEDEEEEEEE